MTPLYHSTGRPTRTGALLGLALTGLVPLALLLLIAALLTGCTAPTTPPDVRPLRAVMVVAPSATPTPAPVICKVSGTVNVRECAGMECAAIAWMTPGQTAEVVQYAHGWTEIKNPGGWVYSPLCTEVKP